MFSTLLDVGRTDIDDGTSDTFGRGNDDVVVFSHLECVERFLGRLVEDSLIDCLWDGIVNKFT